MKNKELYPLVKRLKNKEEAAFEEVFNKLWSTVYYLAYYYTGNNEVAKDITQETFITIYNKIDNLKDEMAFNRWINRIIINSCLNYQKVESRMSFLDIDDGNNEVLEENIEFLPKELLSDKSKQKDLLAAIANLPMKLKSVVLFYYFEDMTIVEISKTLDIAVGTVHKRLVKALNILRSNLKDEYSKSFTSVNVLSIILKQNSKLLSKESIKKTMFKEIKHSLKLKSSSIIHLTTIIKLVVSIVVVTTVCYGGYKLLNDNQQTIVEPIKETNKENNEVKDYSTLEAYVGKDNADLIRSWKVRNIIESGDTFDKIIDENKIQDAFYYIDPDTQEMYTLYQRNENQYTLLLAERYNTYNKEWNVVYQIIDSNDKMINQSQLKEWFLSLEK